ncbi:hypothetical protein [Streptomyces sp. NBC_01235]|uniref:hypothetical protein n=1 Tax=Streptomyces sp. NBC_01235 TaxID=2903788 RepID=UPI002E0E8E68|nr:hypothetical protein OG289_38645 [Streptomyces sp. NBC_01235]
MSRRPQSRRVTLAGREAVALTPQEYEQLIASRRRIGGRSARVRVLGRQAKRSERLLDELETLVAVPGPGLRAGGRGPRLPALRDSGTAAPSP